MILPSLSPLHSLYPIHFPILRTHSFLYLSYSLALCCLQNHRCIFSNARQRLSFPYSSSRLLASIASATLTRTHSMMALFEARDGWTVSLIDIAPLRMSDVFTEKAASGCQFWQDVCNALPWRMDWKRFGSR